MTGVRVPKTVVVVFFEPPSGPLKLPVLEGNMTGARVPKMGLFGGFATSLDRENEPHNWSNLTVRTYRTWPSFPSERIPDMGVRMQI